MHRAVFQAVVGSLVLASAPAAAAERIVCDPATRALVASAGTSDDRDGAAAVVVSDASDVTVEESGRAHVVRRRLLAALTEAGAAALAVQRFDYDPATSWVEVRRVTVYRADGTCEAVDPAGAADLPQPAWSIYWGMRMRLLGIPRLAPGEAVETETYFTGFQIAYLDQPQDEERFVPPMRGHFYDTVLFGDEPWPVMEKRYEVTTPRDKPLLYETYGPPVSVSATLDDAVFRYAFRATDRPAAPHEPMAPGASDHLSKVVMATVPGWPEKSRWFFHANDPQFAADDAVRAAVAEILEGVTGDEARVEALNRWVAHRVRYRGFSLGPQEGYTMHPGTLVLENRAGVCKDKAGMLVTLLRAAGYEAYPAMTMAGSRVERIAADQFNHAVVAWRQADGTFRLVDPTWAPFSQDLWSRAETEQHYLVGTPEGEDLAITPAEGPERNGLAMTAETRLAADGTITGTVRIEPAGYLDDRIRRLFGRSSALETRALVEEIAMRLAPAAEVTSHRMLDPFSLDDPFFLEFAYRAERHAAADGDLIRLRPPATRHPFGAGRLADYLSAVAGPDRTTPVMLRSAQRLTARERIALPERFDLVAPVDERVETSLGGFTGRIAQEGRTLIVEWTTEIRKRMLTVGDYGALRDLVAAAGAFAERSVLLRRGAAGRGGAR